MAKLLNTFYVLILFICSLVNTLHALRTPDTFLIYIIFSLHVQHHREITFNGEKCWCVRGRSEPHSGWMEGRLTSHTYLFIELYSVCVGIKIKWNPHTHTQSIRIPSWPIDIIHVRRTIVHKWMDEKVWRRKKEWKEEVQNKIGQTRMPPAVSEKSSK